MMRMIRTAWLALALTVGPTLALAVPPSASPPPATVSTAAPGGVIMWGDSLTVANQDLMGVTIPSALQALLGVPVTGLGIAGQQSTGISMRQGGTPIQLTLTGNQITYNGVTATAINGVSVVGMNTAQNPDYRFLSAAGDTTARFFLGSVCGVHGQLTRTASGGPPSTSETYFFLPDQNTGVTSWLAASPKACPANSVFTPDTNSLLAYPTILEAGRNNTDYQSQILTDLAASVSALGHSRYLILSIPNGETEPSGNATYNKIVAINNAIAAAYPNNYFDVRAYLVSQYDNSNPVDVYDHTNDIVPYTLRAINQRGTLNGSINSSTCSINLTYTLGSGVYAGQIVKLDSEYIYVSAVSGGNITGCTRAYGTGGVAASHTSGVAFTGTDNLHWSSGADSLIAAKIIATYKSALLGQLPTTLPTAMSLGQVLASTNTWNYLQTFAGGANFPTLDVHLGYGVKIQAAVSGGKEATLASMIAPATINIGGVQNTGVCLSVGGTTPSTCHLGVSSAGATTLAKLSTPAAGPGAGYGALAMVCGTNAGTLKLIAMGGTSATPVTVLDNIGSGVTGC